MLDDSIFIIVLSTIIVVGIVILFFVYTPESSLFQAILCTTIIASTVLLILVLTIDIKDTKLYKKYFEQSPNETNIFNATANFTH
jgi:predicted signal transduction protein with EAL and GGDEF domain